MCNVYPFNLWRHVVGYADYVNTFHYYRLHCRHTLGVLEQTLEFQEPTKGLPVQSGISTKIVTLLWWGLAEYRPLLGLGHYPYRL